MQEDLQYLLELSTVDKKVYELKLTKKDLPVRIQTLKEEIEREKANAEKHRPVHRRDPGKNQGKPGDFRPGTDQS